METSHKLIKTDNSLYGIYSKMFGALKIKKSKRKTIFKIEKPI